MLGDDFGFKSFDPCYYQKTGVEKYMMTMYEVRGFNNDKKASYGTNLISRMRNCLVGSIRDQKALPKFIIVVLDDDLINYIQLKIGNRLLCLDRATAMAFDRVLQWLMNQFRRLIATQKEYLPPKG